MTCDTCDSFGYLLTAPATYQSGGEMVPCPVCQPPLTAGTMKAANLADFEMVDELRRRGWSVRPAVKPTEAGAINCLAEQYEAEGSPLTAEELRTGGNPHNSRWTIRAMLAFARDDAATPSQPLDAATVERWVPQIGQRVRVTEASEFAGDWARTDLWVSGISVHGSGDGLDVTVAEEWPVYPRGRHHNGQTDGWRVGATSCRDQLEPLATEPHQHGGKGA